MQTAMASTVLVRLALWVFCWLPAASALAAESLPPFELTNWNGRTVSADSLKGKTTLLVFTYARCVFGCPMITHQLKELDSALDSPPDLHFLHISVNPVLDTPGEILKHFEKHNIDPRKDARWLFLRGSRERTERVLSDFGIAVKRTPIEGGVLVEHTIKVLVIDPDGKLVAAFSTYQWEEEEMRHALRSLHQRD